VVAGVGGGDAGGGVCGRWWGRRAAVVASLAVSQRGVGQQVGSAVAPVSFFVLENLLCREPYGALGTSVTRVFTLALGKEPFVGPAVPSGLCREFPLGTGCVECIPACAESNSLSANPWIPVVYTLYGCKLCLGTC
jgi:hypothetical protein